MKIFKTKLLKAHSSTADFFSQPFGNQLKLHVWSAQSVGKTRSHMEDASAALTLDLFLPERRTTLGIYLIADGMGGHESGEVASKIAIERCVDVLTERLIDPLRRGELMPSDQEVIEMIDAAFARAQEQVLLNVSGGGTTLTLALLLGKHLYFGHIGDSRLYFRSGSVEFRALTQDHSLVRRLVDLGQISEEEAAHHPQRNVLFRALGQTDGFKVDLGHLPLTEPTQLLICSDGLWSLVEESNLLEAIKSVPYGENTAERLCELANEAGGTDNISIIFVEIR